MDDDERGGRPARHPRVVAARVARPAGGSAAEPTARARELDSTPGERKLLEKRPSESANAITYAFSTDEELRDTYRNPWGHVRAGRLLEDLDAIAGTVAADETTPRFHSSNCLPSSACHAAILGSTAPLVRRWDV